MATYKRFPANVWNLFEELLKTRLTGIKGKLAELELGIKKVAASETADKLTTAYTIDGVDFDGSGDIKHYGVCTTASSVAIKTVACSGFKLVNGARITVRFDNADTSTDSTQLNVNSTGNRLIKYKGEALPKYALEEDTTYLFIYNGQWFDFVGSLGKIYEPFAAATNEANGSEGLVPAPTAGKDSSYFLNANGAWTIPHDTTYTIFTAAGKTTAGTTGLVPAPSVGDDETKYLNSKGQWTKVSGVDPFTAATSEVNGTSGAVPAPSVGDGANKFLSALGTWAVPVNTTYVEFTAATANAAGTAGLVPAPSAGDGSNKFLNATGSWVVPPDTKYSIFGTATTTSPGTTGLVPAPSIGDGVSKYLTAIGTWTTPPVVTSSANGYMSVGDKSNLDYLFHQTSTSYAVGDQVHVKDFPTYMVLECTTAGTTSNSAPDFATAAATD